MLRTSASYSFRSFSTSSIAFAQNLTEKIAQKYAVNLPANKEVHSGDYISIKPQHCMSHDNSWPIALKFMNIGGSKIYDNRQIVNTIDHDVQNKSEKNLTKYNNIKNFALKHGIDFYPPGAGIGHQIMIEQGYAFPNTLTVASDSHSNTYGGIGCLGTPIVRTDAAAIWATGQTWWQIPPVAQVELKGELPKGCSGKDVIVGLCGVFNNDEVLNHCIEFTGDSISKIPIDYRLTIANMTTEWGALSGIFPIDNTLIDWYKTTKVKDSSHPRLSPERIENELVKKNDSLKADPDCKYDKKLIIDLSTLTHYVSGPNSVKIGQPVQNLNKKPINKAYLVSCTNSRLSDLQMAAEILQNEVGTKIAPGVEFYVAAASSLIEQQAKDLGYWDTFIRAGCTILPPGCGPCIGLGAGLLKEGEVGISATNRNFKGRMGSKDALAYLASPAVVAASAIKGYIASPAEILGQSYEPNFTGIKHEIIELGDTAAADTANTSSEGVEILDGFPKEIVGELILCDADNINTDGIYPGKYTYQDDVPKEKMAQVCMENYDPEFINKTKPGDILISGFNFGTGSSREQAATAILARGINLVVSGSFGNIFSRNSINNALLTLEIPKLIDLLRKKYKDLPKELTRRTGWFLKWDVANASVVVTEGEGKDAPVILETKVGELGKNLQEIIVKGGLEGWVKSKL
ncbi:probable Homoaconitase, mitochondrial [Saccharomycodes ludwigii]|uniref:Homoaconitase, mitochondrial n=1 Tax=Saccharomycodes ludwigii TaxID=36035 RepID=A0A376B794_9ASCO|nr:hypothetical protein SCDLUD_001925 [Saccharomycodes ludwigii]KAH3902112.1 hypothetical protein SCDLUD_001925 [Saccharomycodes ludwigii]SSD60543.1 probable Homoaconitase, mitochondrial [Saccharomycodes ludwigii]